LVATAVVGAGGVGSAAVLITTFWMAVEGVAVLLAFLTKALITGLPSPRSER
jgi:hypothetical protein